MDKHMPSPESTLKHKKLALGRGLSALIPDAGPTFQPEDGFFLCEIDLIRPNRFQPRHQFAEEELAELTGSIREQGVLQPLIVRKSDPGFELIAGERRLRAARRAGLSQVPVVLKAVSDDQLLELSLVENIQRENLNPIEEAEAYHRLIQQLHLTQDQAAARVGKSRSAVANFLRLRQLPEEVKASIVKGGLSMGHARALLGAENGAGDRGAGAAPEGRKEKAAGFHAWLRGRAPGEPVRRPLASSGDQGHHPKIGKAGAGRDRVLRQRRPGPIDHTAAPDQALTTL
jgi:ParB family chromosome partitioning protein